MLYDDSIAVNYIHLHNAFLPTLATQKLEVHTAVVLFLFII